MNRSEVSKWCKQLGITQEFSEIGCGMWAHTVPITPELASKWLERNVGNRPQKESSISKYANDMDNDEFVTTHEGIAFDEEGILRDGQNRLEAIVISGKTIVFLVVFGITKKSALYIDQGKNRSSLDAGVFAVNSGLGNTLRMRSEHGAVKYVHNGYSDFKKSVSNKVTLDLLDLYNDGLDFASKSLKKVNRVTTTSAVQAAIIRAYQHYKDSNASLIRLRRFCKILSDGQFQDIEEDNAPSRLRDKLMTEKIFGRPREIYAYTQYAIYCFMHKKPLKRMQQAQEELFPFPHEKVLLD
jgi:hypothetical protein